MERVRTVKRRGWPLANVGLLLAIGLLTWNLIAHSRPLHDLDAAPRVVTPRGSLAEDELSTIELFEGASPSVVYISTVSENSRSNRNLFEIEDSGSGLVWDRDGTIVTNYHVVHGNGRLLVTLSDQTHWDARLVGFDDTIDLAVLKIDAPASRLQPIPIGESSLLRVGQKVFAIGNPFGLDHTLTTGIISGLDRELESEFSGHRIYGLIQTDAAINPGNSGGPLLDSAGRLIGVNSAIVSLTGASAGVGFAVPVDTINKTVPQIMRHGRPDRPGLGIMIEADYTNRRKQDKFLVQGVFIRDVLPGTAAERAGLRATESRVQGNHEFLLGDLITGIDEREITTTEDLLQQLGQFHIGEAIELQVHRYVDGELPRLLRLPIILQGLN